MLRLRVRNLQELREKHSAGDYVSGKWGRPEHGIDVLCHVRT